MYVLQNSPADSQMFRLHRAASVSRYVSVNVVKLRGTSGLSENAYASTHWQSSAISPMSQLLTALRHRINAA